MVEADLMISQWKCKRLVVHDGKLKYVSAPPLILLTSP